jgi:hypothetical protein
MCIFAGLNQLKINNHGSSYSEKSKYLEEKGHDAFGKRQDSAQRFSGFYEGKNSL